ncbi:hypothetical protein V1478_014239 [Vespula squamosa]|uniref:Uncharacterized protein n=1 Tax=Vespula squamosa TaxID=30214 RepID=A0ABD2A7F8_VESSQ
MYTFLEIVCDFNDRYGQNMNNKQLYCIQSIYLRNHSPGSTCIELNFDISQVLPTQVSPRGGCCIWRPMG